MALWNNPNILTIYLMRTAFVVVDIYKVLIATRGFGRLAPWNNPNILTIYLIRTASVVTYTKF